MCTYLYIIHIHKHSPPHTDTHQAFHLFSSDQILALQSTGPLLWTDVLRSLWGNDKCRLKSVAKPHEKIPTGVVTLVRRKVKNASVLSVLKLLR